MDHLNPGQSVVQAVIERGTCSPGRCVVDDTNLGGLFAGQDH
jgi:hypothetical protein